MSDTEAAQIPDVMVELLLLGELEPEEAAAIRARLNADDDPRISEIERSNEALLARYPVAEVAAELRAAAEAANAEEPDAKVSEIAVVAAQRWSATHEPRTEVVSPSSHRTRGVVWVSALVAIAAALVLAWGLRDASRSAQDESPQRVSMTQTPAPPSDGRRHKGSQRLIVFRQGSDDALQSDEGVAEGDVLQLAYSAAGERYGVIVSLDGAGAVTLHWPANATDSTELGTGVVRLDYAYELDDAPSFERFVFVASSQPLPPDVVMDAAQVVASGTDPEHAELRVEAVSHQVSVRLDKVPPR